jgi:hypothetical protein
MRRIAPLLLLTATAYAKPPPEAAAYLGELERRGLVDKGEGTPARLAAEVRAADDELTAGRPAQAAARLYAIVEAPRFADLSESDDFQDAEYRLGLALHRGGSARAARRYLGRVLARGPQAALYLPALRAMVDTCLDEHEAASCIAELDAAHIADENEELAYLRGRAAFDAGQPAAAERELARVGSRSRFYSSALYLRGVMRVQRCDLKGAEEAFCAVADTREGESLRFFIDGRYYQLRDLARLALGRVAHEEKRYPDAFYHYFLIPSDSPKLPDALFEAAWSSLERKEYDLGARLVDELVRQFPDSPRAAEAPLLRATLQVKSCRFADAERGFDAFLRTHEPLLAVIDHALATPAARRRIGERLLDLKADGDDAVRQIAALLRVDPRFYRLQALARGLRDEAVDAAHVEAAWRALASRVAGTAVQPVSVVDAARLAADTRRLGAELDRERERGHALDELEARRQRLAAELERALALPARAVAPAGDLPSLVSADAAAAAELRARIGRLEAKLDAAAGDLVAQALGELRTRLEGLLRRARLGKIDAVIGAKRKLERQIEDLAAGRFPPELFGKLHVEGLIGDDEEYWPPEGEQWADEYEGYK